MASATNHGCRHPRRPWSERTRGTALSPDIYDHEEPEVPREHEADRFIEAELRPLIQPASRGISRFRQITTAADGKRTMASNQSTMCEARASRRRSS
jgi:hypothetical protein